VLLASELEDKPLLAVHLQKGVVRVEYVIAKELPHRAMDGIGAGLRDDVHVGTGIAAEASIVVRCLNFEFLQRVRIWNGDAGLLHKVACAA
jgi:hypothetical protein